MSRNSLYLRSVLLVVAVSFCAAPAGAEPQCIGRVVKQISDKIFHDRNVEFQKSIAPAYADVKTLIQIIEQLLTLKEHRPNDCQIRLRIREAIQRFSLRIWEVLVRTVDGADEIINNGEREIERVLARWPRRVLAVDKTLERMHLNLWKGQDEITANQDTALKRLQSITIKLVSKALEAYRLRKKVLFERVLREIPKCIYGLVNASKASALGILAKVDVVMHRNADLIVRQAEGHC